MSLPKNGHYLFHYCSSELSCHNMLQDPCESTDEANLSTSTLRRKLFVQEENNKEMLISPATSSSFSMEIECKLGSPAHSGLLLTSSSRVNTDNAMTYICHFFKLLLGIFVWFIFSFKLQLVNITTEYTLSFLITVLKKHCQILFQCQVQHCFQPRVQIILYGNRIDTLLPLSIQQEIFIFQECVNTFFYHCLGLCRSVLCIFHQHMVFRCCITWNIRCIF